MSKNLKIVATIFIILSLIFGLIVRLFVIFHFVDFTGDQINDAYRTMGIWEGIFPTLGPGPAAWSKVSGGEIYLPPLYYYLVFPFTIFTASLSSQAISNAVFTFVSIPLLIFIVYKSLPKRIDYNIRFLLSALAGFWYAFLFRNIALSTGNSLAGNPVSITFFLLAFILLYTYQLESKLSPRKEVLSWITYGVVLAILMSLHFSTLFVMPVIFILSIIFYIYKNYNQPRKLLLPGLSIISTIITLTPYWLGEINRNWVNSKNIVSLIINASSEKERTMGIISRIRAIIRAYLDLGTDLYFLGNSWKTSLISLAFLLTILLIVIFKFKGRGTIFYLSLITWAVFLYAYSSTNLDITYNPIFYKMLIYTAPIFLSIWSLASLDMSKIVEKILIIFIIFSIFISILINLNFHYNYITARAGMPRIPNISDLAYILKEEIPEQSTICHPFGYRNIRAHEYTDKYISQRNLKFAISCQVGHYFIYSKYKSVGNFSKRVTKPVTERFDTSDKDYTFVLFKETPLSYIYILERAK